MTKRAPGERETPYERHKLAVLHLLRRRCPWLAADEREVAYHDAYATLLEKHRDGALDMDAMHDRQVRSYLMTAAIHRGLWEGARAERKRTTPVENPGAYLVDASPSAEERMVAASETGPVRELVEELPERRRAVIKLRFWLDRSPREIQAFLGISERAYRKELERAFGQLAERFLLVSEGRWCQERRSLVLAYVAGVAGPTKARQARMHLESCPGCARLAAELRDLAERAAAVAPMPELARGDGPLGRLAEAGVALKEQLAGAGEQAKTQAASLLSRADPGAPAYLAGARPGGAVALVVGCLAVGGGATYCAVEGLPDPIGAIVDSQPELREPAEPVPREEPIKEELPVEVSPQPPPPSPDPVQTAPPETPPPSEPPPPEPPPDPANEFTPDANPAPLPAAAPTVGEPTGEFGAPAGSAGGAAGGEFAP
jgi:DNA-directed RNA polymerase specialized sigma24 family protein